MPMGAANLHAPVSRHDAVTACPSCHAHASGNFCANCGETLHHHLPSAGEFVHEFIGHYVAAEGKLLQTIKLLLFRPGQLTIDFLRGRRMPTIGPLRLYLTLSLILFALIKWNGVELPQLVIHRDSVGLAYEHRFSEPGRTGKPGAATLYLNAHESTTKPAASGEPVFRDKIHAAIVTLGAVHRTWRTNLEAFMAEPEQEQDALLNHGILANLPYMLIAAVPLFALYLKLLYRGAHRDYGAHLVFALHVNAFAFLLASCMSALPGTAVWVGIATSQQAFRFITAWDYLQLLPLAWLLAYLPVAMQRVYGGSRFATACKWVVLLSVHMLMIAVLTVLAELIGVLQHG